MKVITNIGREIKIMKYFVKIFLPMILVLQLVVSQKINSEINNVSGSSAELAKVLRKCKLGSASFDKCMKNVFNELRAFFGTGIPEYGIRPFDPHRCAYVEARRGEASTIGFSLILRNVSEHGWTDSKVTKFRFEPNEDQIVYSQYFGDKRLEGQYEFSGRVFGTPTKNHGIWNLTLSDYSQTTTIRRIGGFGSLLKVQVVVDRIGGMVLHISDFFGKNQQQLNSITDTLINSMWQLGLPIIRPLINELVSTAFTDIFNESFRYFPLEKFIT